MKKIFLIFTLFLFFISSCKTQKKFPEVNSKFNSQYRKSTEFFKGHFNKTKYKTFLNIIERELDTIIPEGKTIILNYYQRAPNCFFANVDTDYITSVINKRLQTSAIISKQYNAIAFSIYTKDAFHKDLYQKNKRFILDRGYFHKAIFTEHKNCKGIFILKPNGIFLKYYGEDNNLDSDAFLRETIKYKK